jgi:transposase InsO family protein
MNSRNRHRVSDSASCGCSRSSAKIDNAVMRIDDASRDGVLARERTAVIAYALAHPQDGYRRLTWQMLDAGVAALSESSVFRILAEADLPSRSKRSRSLGSAPPRPTQPNERWHTDLIYLRIADSWYFLITVLDAYSRYVVHWDLLTAMTAADVRRVIEKALQQTRGRRW